MKYLLVFVLGLISCGSPVVALRCVEHDGALDFVLHRDIDFAFSECFKSELCEYDLEVGCWQMSERELALYKDCLVGAAEHYVVLLERALVPLDVYRCDEKLMYFKLEDELLELRKILGGVEKEGNRPEVKVVELAEVSALQEELLKLQTRVRYVISSYVKCEPEKRRWRLFDYEFDSVSLSKILMEKFGLLEEG